MTPTDAPSPAPAGLLTIDKPVGPTSMAVCRLVRARLVRGGAPKRIKVGHGGTLDPLATGVLVVLVGKATRLCDTVMAADKTYLADIDLHRTSPTDDLEAPPRPAPLPPGTSPPDAQTVERVIAGFTGRVMQAPPAHSAMKIEGKRAYELARRGDIDQLEKRPVQIHAIDVLLYRWPRLVLRVRCGKGVYIRSLARDIGAELGGGGLLAGLRRTAIGGFTENTAALLRALPAVLTQADLAEPPRAPPR